MHLCKPKAQMPSTALNSPMHHSRLYAIKNHGNAQAEERISTPASRLNDKGLLGRICRMRVLMEEHQYVHDSFVAVAILPIAEDLQFTVPLIPWILSAYTITFAGLLLFSGRMGDLFSRRRMFMFGLSWFATWALVISFSTTPIMFVIVRCPYGVGFSCTVSTATALIANYPPGPGRTKAFSVFASFGGLGAVVGVLLADRLTATIG